VTSTFHNWKWTISGVEILDELFSLEHYHMTSFNDSDWLGM